MAALDLAGPSQPYEEFFGLVGPPFDPAPDPRFFFDSRSHRATLDLVFGTFGQGESAVIIGGDPGTGKTLLCRVAVEQAPPRTFLAVVPSPVVDRATFFAQILEQFGIFSPDSTIPPPHADQLVAALEQFLASLPVLQAHAVIMVDEAQEIRPDLLREIRSLTNAGAESGRRLRIVLLGEPALLEILVASNHALLAQTSDARVLSPLATDEIEPYIERRLWIARGSPIPDTPGGPGGVRFARDSVTAVAACSGGVPGTINALCHYALEDACVRGKHIVDRRAVMAAARQLGIPVAFWTRLRPYRTAALAAALVVGAAIAWVKTGGSSIPGFSSNGPAPGETRPAAALARTDAPAVSAPPGSAAPSAAAAGSAATPAPTAPPAPEIVPVVNATLQRVESFTVLVASFRTTSRAQAAADAIAALGLPSYMRAIQGGWHSVVVGPYATRTEADGARERVEGAHFTGTRVLSTPSTDPEPGLSASSALARVVLLPVTGRSTVAVDLTAEPIGASLGPGVGPRSAEVEIGPLPGRIEHQDLVPARPGVLERVSVRGVTQGDATTVGVSVGTREPVVVAVRREGRRVYIDLTYSTELPASGPGAAGEAPSVPPGTP